VFVLKDQVDNARIPINPLGLTITYFREDQAFVNDAGRTPWSRPALPRPFVFEDALTPSTRREPVMPFIPRQVKPPARLPLTCKVPEATATLLKLYAEFLDSTQEYVVVQTLSLAFRKDKEFL
jgi:hypothetical protein